MDEPVANLAAERDLYLQLLGLGECESVEAFVREALALLVTASGARHGYLELYGDDGDEPRWWTATGLTDETVESVRRFVSRGIVAETLAGGKLVATFAVLDSQFNQRASVQESQLGAVLCAPIGEDGARGVVYLEGRSAPGKFSEQDQERVRVVARHLAVPAKRLLEAQRREACDDPTLALRRSMRLDGIVGRSQALASALRQVALVAPLDVTVLLTGDSGTGKSMLARVIHDNGPRAGKPFVEVNCGALPENLVESELFGALPGAHSTAVRRVDGKVTAAEGGTLFLDEIALLSPTAQRSLLQLLQSKQYYPLGSSTPRSANVRVIAATNVDLQKAVSEGAFREDLYYRLHVLPIRVPSLAERGEDLPELADALCRGACERNNLPIVRLSGNALRAVQGAAWPGNVRQLANALEAAAIRAAAERATQIERRHLFPDDGAADPHVEGNRAQTFQEATRRFQGELIAATLRDTGWNVVETARRLDMARSHLYTLIRAFDLERGR